MNIAEEFIKHIDEMSDEEFQALLDKVRPLREHSISVDECLKATQLPGENWD